ncbi:protein TolQ [Dokdonella ginsengisoli]|uniref:Tol-Pal system protein TolQ n=1 Tax=Dokdonella ginsengisoli TaxID=363846 RepID=A0ABV9QQX3_9GAMM
MNTELNVLALVLGASLPVKLVLGILIAFSIASWFIIFRKKAMIDRANASADEFEERFWSGADLAGLFKEITSGSERVTGSAAIFEAGFREFARLRQRRAVDSRALLEGAQRAMRVSSTREIDRLEQSLEFLANVGSISPYVGLFGTVWGIMIAFQGLANVKEATIAMVAPGISEALIATAMGLFAAIPAVWAYNRYSTKLERVNLRYDTFVEEFSSILARQAHLEDAP